MVAVEAASDEVYRSQWPEVRSGPAVVEPLAPLFVGRQLSLLLSYGRISAPPTDRGPEAGLA